MEGERTDEYLEAIYKRQSHKTPVSTSSLAHDLKVSAPAITDMLKSLESQGLIIHRPNKGATLTDSGMLRALKIIRRHRLWERFLTDILGMKWDTVHDEACKLEHIDSPEIEKGLANVLGDVDTCPHGHTIPDENGKFNTERAVPLSKTTSKKVYIAAIAEETPRILKNIEKLGLRPGMAVTVLQKNKNGSIDVEVDHQRISLDSEIPGILLVRPLPAEKPAAVEEEIPLIKLATGQTGYIRSYKGRRAMLGRCLSLGFTPGSTVKMVENYGRGPVLVKVHDTQVALGRGLAEKILVNKNAETC